MKKFVAVVMMVVLVTLSLGMAQAEVKVVSYSVLYGVNELTGEKTAERYSITFQSDETGEKFNVVVDEESYNKIALEFEADWQKMENDSQNRWYKKVCRWTKNAATDVADWVTFWN